MATKLTKFKTGDYGIIPRGCSFSIPVIIHDDQDRPIDLSEYKCAFTVKRYKHDFDRHDDYVFCKTDFYPQSPTEGHFWVALTSKDTDFDPGDYYFDIELVHLTNGLVWRIVTMQFKLDGGPTNRHINPGTGQLVYGDTISVITMTEGNPIVVIAPTLSLPNEMYSKVADLLNQYDSLKQAIENLEASIAKHQKDYESLSATVQEISDLVGV